MLKFLKNLVKKKPAEEAKIVSEAELLRILEKEKKKREELIIKRVENAGERIEKISEETEVLLKNFESAELYNKKVTPKEISFMVGNRIAYIKNTRDFLRKISNEFNNSEEYEKILFESRRLLESLSKNNQRPYAVLQHFFANEARSIGEKIKRVSDEIEAIKKEITSEEINLLKESITSLNERAEKKKAINKLEIEIEIKKEQLADVIENRKKTVAQQKKVEAGKDFIEFTNLSEEKEGVLEELKKIEADFASNFSSIESTIRKYSRVSLEPELVEKLAINPVHAVLNNTNASVSILEKIKAAVENESLDIKDKKKEKVLIVLSGLDKDFIGKFTAKDTELRGLRQKIDHKLNQNGVIRDYQELEYKIKHLDSKHAIIEMEIENIKKKIERMEVIPPEKEFIEKAESLLDMKIEVI